MNRASQMNALSSSLFSVRIDIRRAHAGINVAHTAQTDSPEWELGMFSKWSSERLTERDCAHLNWRRGNWAYLC